MNPKVNRASWLSCEVKGVLWLMSYTHQGGPSRPVAVAPRGNRHSPLFSARFRVYDGGGAAAADSSPAPVAQLMHELKMGLLRRACHICIPADDTVVA